MKIDEFISSNAELEVIRCPAKRTSSVYLICSEDGEIIYIGRTMDMETRMLVHNGRKEFKKTIRYFFEYPQSEYKEKERELIKAIEPKFNIKELPKREGRVNRCYLDIDKIKDRLLEIGWTPDKLARKLGKGKADIKYTFYLGHTGPKHY